MNDLETFAQWLKLKRKEKKLTQEQLAVESNLGRTYVNAIENGRIKLPQSETREKLHNVLGTSDAELVDLELLAFENYGSEYIPDRRPDLVRQVVEANPLSAVHIEGLSQTSGGPYGLLGAALVYAFRAMNRGQRKAVLKLLTEISDSLDVSAMDDVPF